MTNHRLPRLAYLLVALAWVMIGLELGSLAYRALQYEGSWKSIAVAVVSTAMNAGCLLSAYTCVNEYARRQH